MPPLQLQLDLWQELQVAEQFPEQTDVLKLCIGMERAIAVTYEELASLIGTSRVTVTRLLGQFKQ